MPLRSGCGWPFSECLGVFLGVLGLEWLIRGQANLLLALVLAGSTGLLVFLLRRFGRRGKH